jgi:hypothetical protein
MSTETEGPEVAPAEAAPTPAEEAAPKPTEAAEAPSGGEGGTEGPPKPPEGTEGDSERPKSAREARERLRERARGRKTRKGEGRTVAEEFNRPRDEQGRFSKEGATEEAEAADAPSGDTPAQADGGTDPEASAKPRESESPPPEGMVRLTIPEGHPLRTDRGVTFIDFPAENEEYGRWAINQATRQREVEQASRQAREMELRAASLEAEAKFWRENAGDILTPEFYQTYNDLKSTYGEAHAEDYKAGVLRRANAQIAERQNEVRKQDYQRRVVSYASAFREKVHEIAPKAYPRWSPADVDQALHRYGQEMERTGQKQFNPKEFGKLATRMYMEHPEVRKELARKAQQSREAEIQKTREEVEREVQEREAARLKEAATNRRRNPMARAPNVDTGRSLETNPSVPRTAKEMRERVRARARGR